MSLRPAPWALLLCATVRAASWSISEGRLNHDTSVVLTSLDANTRLEPSGDRTGAALTVTAVERFHEHTFTIGRLHSPDKFAAAWRGRTSCWMDVAIGDATSVVPRETQFLLVRHGDGAFTIFIPVLDAGFRASLTGGPDGELSVVVESGDPAVETLSVRALYLIHGRDPYAMMATAAREICGFTHPAETTPERTLPDFAHYLGWCTWNAFYDKVDATGLEVALRGFVAQGVAPGFVLIDDGWQQSENRVLTGLGAAPAKFPEGIDGITRKLKSEFGVHRLLVWQTLWGYWTGTSRDKLPGAGVRLETAHVPDRFQPRRAEPDHTPTPADAQLARFYPQALIRNPIPMPDFAAFFPLYHGALAGQGVDGVKVDAMTWLELYGAGHGGRVRRMGELIRAMNTSSTELFANNCIHCSACSSDFILQAPRNAVTRTSGDFDPKTPASHGVHVWTNAHTSFWMGEFVIPDWDMFQSGHAAGAFHAAARAISGGPVYSADEIGKTDATVLRKLAMSDRRVPQCDLWARPTLDSFFIDPRRDHLPIKIFNANRHGWVIGAFNCCYDSQHTARVIGAISPADIPGTQDERFALFVHTTGQLISAKREESVPVDLAELGFELVTIVPIHAGFAPVGLVDKFNSGGTIRQVHQNGKSITVDLSDGGIFVAYSERKPNSVSINGNTTAFDFDESRHRLTISAPIGKPVELAIGL